VTCGAFNTSFVGRVLGKAEAWKGGKVERVESWKGLKGGKVHSGTNMHDKQHKAKSDPGLYKLYVLPKCLLHDRVVTANIQFNQIGE